MVQQTNITFKEELWFDEQFQATKKKRLLSKLINELLIGHYSVKPAEIPTDETDINDELRDIAIRKAILMDKKEEVSKEKEAEERRKEDEHQMLLKRIPVGNDFHSKLAREQFLKEHPEIDTEKKNRGLINNAKPRRHKSR